MYGDINIDLDDKEVEAFLSRLHKVLLLKTVDNLTSVEMEPDSDFEEEEQDPWMGCLPGEDRYCTACSMDLIIGTNIAANRLKKRYYLCQPCSTIYKQGNKDGLAITDIFRLRYCHMCGDGLNKENCHRLDGGKVEGRCICNGCREDVRQKWFDSEHKCIHCACVLNRGGNWHESAYKARTHVCKNCRYGIAEKSAKKRRTNQN
jgi:hypothetical protein